MESGLSRVVGRRSWVALARQGSAKLKNAINIARLSPNVRPTAATTTGTATARVTKGSCSWGRGRHGEGTGAGQREFAHAQTAHTYGMRWLSTDIGQCVAATEGAGCEWEWQKVRGGGCRIDIGRVSGVVAKRIRKSCLLASQFAGAAYGLAMQIRRRRTLHLPRSSFRPQGKPARANKKRNTRRNEGTKSRRDEVAGLAIVNRSGARAILILSRSPCLISERCNLWAKPCIMPLANTLAIPGTATGSRSEKFSGNFSAAAASVAVAVAAWRQ